MEIGSLLHLFVTFAIRTRESLDLKKIRKSFICGILGIMSTGMQNMNTFEYRGKCGNNISTISGWRKEWRDMYERYAVRGSHLDSWDDKYLRTSAPAVPSAASIASAPAQFCTAAFLRNQ